MRHRTTPHCLSVLVLVVLLAVTCAGAARAAGDDLAQVRSLVSQKKYDDAFGRVRQYLSAHPGDAEARLLQGIIESRQGRTRQATETFRKLVVDHPDLPEPLNTGEGFMRAAFDYKVLTVPGEYFDVNPNRLREGRSPLTEYVRFSFGPPLDNVRAGLDRLAEMVKARS